MASYFDEEEDDAPALRPFDRTAPRPRPGAARAPAGEAPGPEPDEEPEEPGQYERAAEHPAADHEERMDVQGEPKPPAAAGQAQGEPWTTGGADPYAEAAQPARKPIEFLGPDGRPLRQASGPAAQFKQQQAQLLAQLPPALRQQYALSQLKLSYAEQKRLDQLQNAASALKANPFLTEEEKAHGLTMLQTGINPLAIRAARAKALHQELQNQAEAMEMQRRAENHVKLKSFLAGNVDKQIFTTGDPQTGHQHTGFIDDKGNIKIINEMGTVREQEHQAEFQIKREEHEEKKRQQAEAHWTAEYHKVDAEAEKEMKEKDKHWEERAAAVTKEGGDGQGLLDSWHKAREDTKAIAREKRLKALGIPATREELDRKQHPTGNAAGGMADKAQPQGWAGRLMSGGTPTGGAPAGQPAGAPPAQPPAPAPPPAAEAKPFDPEEPRTMTPDQKKAWNDLDYLAKLQPQIDTQNRDGYAVWVKEARDLLRKHGTVQNMPAGEQEAFRNYLGNMAIVTRSLRKKK